MARYLHCVLVWAMGTAILTSVASANTFSWTYQRISDDQQSTGHNLGIAMRTGATWPTVFRDSDSGDPSVMASSLTPVGWMDSNIGFRSNEDSFVRAAEGQDGRVGGAYQFGDVIRFAQSSSAGWQTSTVATTTQHGAAYAPGVAYLSGNRPIVSYVQAGHMCVAAHNGLSWESDVISYAPGHTAPDSGTYTSVAVTSQDGVGVAYVGTSQSEVCLAFKDTLTSTWRGSTIANLPQSVEHLSLVFGPDDKPGLAILDGTGTLSYADYDVQSGSWDVEYGIATGVTSGRVNLEFDGMGNPALSYVAGTHVVCSFDDGVGWADVSLPIDNDPLNGLYRTPTPQSDAALAFDADGIPLIAYYNGYGELLLAYDPPVTPEPTACLLLLSGSWWVLRRHAGRR